MVALEVPVMTAGQTIVTVAGEPLMMVADFQEFGAVDVFACEPPDRSAGRGIINQR